MRLAYLDGFAGVSGDMLLGAFVQAGVSVELLAATLNKLEIGATLEVAEVDRSGIQAVKATILTGGRLAEAVPAAVQHHSRENEPADDAPAESSRRDGGHSHPPHTHSSPQSSSESHRHGGDVRSLSAIRALIERAALPGPVTMLALRAFTLLGEAEAKIHHVPLEKVHFHEVGAVDAIADIVLTAAAAHALEVDEWHCSPLNVGGGTVECAHGRFPVPAPATADLLRGAPTYSSGIQAELVTPTGAALVRALGCRFGPAPLMRAKRIGYGAGTRNPARFANVLRLTLGESEPVTKSSVTDDFVTVIETAVDDLNPQVIAYVTDRALQLGALDVMCTPVFMKKNRPGTLLTVLASSEKAAALQDLLLRETSTLGLRIRQERRVCLQREHVTVTTAWGDIRVKVGSHEGEEFQAAAEFEDCRKIADSHAVPLKRVMEAAMAAYRKRAA